MDDGLLFDVQQYQEPERAIAEDGDGDYEDPRYVTLGKGFWWGDAIPLVRALYEHLPKEEMTGRVLELRSGVKDFYAPHHPNTSILFTVTAIPGSCYLYSLSEWGKRIAKILLEELPKDAELMEVKLGRTRVFLTWAAHGGMQKGAFPMPPAKRKHGDGWATMESRVSQGRYTQWYLHYQLPGGKKRSKYIPSSKVKFVREMVDSKDHIADILAIITKKKAGK